MKIFVWGHKGFIGSHLVPALEKAGHKVVTSHLFFAQGYDVIINLAGKTHIRNEFDPEMIESNIILAERIFSRPERIIYASSCSAAHFTNPYAWTKMWNEYLGKKHGNALGFRFHNVYGPGNNKGIVKFLMDQPNGAKIKIRGPELVRDYIHVSDVVKEIMENLKPTKKRKICKGSACIMVDAKNVGVRDMGTGVGTETMDLVNLYQRLSGKKFDISIEEAGDNEPKSMISNNIVPHMKLEDGLLKMINNA